MASKVSILVSFWCFMVFMGSSYSETKTDTLLQGQKLKGGDQLVSAFGTFRLGFFRSEGRYYVGIWYYTFDGNITPHSEYYSNYRKPVWVANRNTPIPIFYKSRIFTIGSDGTLKISHSGGDLMVSTSVQASGITSATLLDSGNLVLRELNSDGSVKRVLWQSFDYPTDTLLPRMKIGINLKTGHSWSLTSWSTDTSAAMGSYSFGMDRNGTNQLTIWWVGELYWTSGIWENGRFKLLYELSHLRGYKFSFVSNENEKYFTYDVTSGEFPMIVISNDGSLSFSGDTLISCSDSFGSSNSVGCVDGKLPFCRKHIIPHFYPRYGSVIGDSFKFNESENLNINDCHEKCLRNCSCVAYGSTNENGPFNGYPFNGYEHDGTGCQIWSKVSIGTSRHQNWHQNWHRIYVLEVESKGQKWILWLAIAIGALVISLLFFLCFLLWRKHKEPVVWPWKMGTLLLMWRKYKENAMQFLQSIKKTNTEQEILLSELGIDAKHNPSRRGKNSHELQFFKFQSIASATNNFACTNKLGQGGFGPVYKGQLPDGQEVAVKRLSTNSRQGLVEFKNEVKVIAKLQHNNLVRLVGCCIEKEEKILIYEYMPNKSLDFFLFDPMNQNVLDWKTRFTIIEGIAQGLLYLHKYSRLKIIHRDLKASNVLLDSEMNPKISDFGMAKIFEPQESRANTNRVVGTYGYMSPEYAMEGVFSTKSDVFSFGVLLLEIVSGKRNNSFHHSDGPLNLIAYAWELWRQGKVLELIDPKIGDTCQNEVLRCIHVGLLCTQENPIDRPTMLDVTSMMYNEANQLPSPKQPAFYSRRTLQRAEIEEQKHENWSLNGVSITEMEAR